MTSLSRTAPLPTVKARPDTARRDLAFLVLLAVAGFAIPHLGVSRLMLSLLTQATISAILATSVGFLVRQCGYVSFGHAAFYGGSAYLLGLIAAHSGLPAEVAIIAAPLIILVVSFLLAFIMLRTSGVAFSMLSLAVSQACFEVMMKWRDIANGEDGIAIRLPREIFGLPLKLFQRSESMFLICWGALLLVILGLWLLSRSHFGTLTRAIKNNEERARFIGYRTMVPRAIMIALSAFIASIAGLLFGLYNAFVTPTSLDWSLSGEALIIAIIGGTRTIWGPALGAFLFFFLRDLSGDYTTHWQAIVGIALILITVMLPSGISGALVTGWNRIKGGRHG